VSRLYQSYGCDPGVSEDFTETSGLNQTRQSLPSCCLGSSSWTSEAGGWLFQELLLSCSDLAFLSPSVPCLRCSACRQNSQGRRALAPRCNCMMSKRLLTKVLDSATSHACRTELAFSRHSPRSLQSANLRLHSLLGTTNQPATHRQEDQVVLRQL
jgi:hypothetical protein